MTDPQPPAPYPLPIRRELLSVEAYGTPNGLSIVMTCDCSAITSAIIEMPLPPEFAISCAGCETSHWLTGGAS